MLPSRPPSDLASAGLFPVSVLATVIVAVFFAVFIGACASEAPSFTRDGAADRNVEAGADLGVDLGPRLPACSLARTVCDGLAVWTCVEGAAGAEIERCAEACSLGRCTTPLCAAAESTDGVRGCLFYGVQVDNIDGDDNLPLMLALGNAGGETARVRIEVRDATGAWTELGSTAVRSRGGARVRLTRPVRRAGVSGAGSGAYRVVSDRPILAVQLVSDDAERSAHSSGGTMLRPLQALGTAHLAVTFPAHETSEVLRYPGSRAGAGAITVVATAPGTRVRLHLTAPAEVSPGMVLATPSSEHDVTLEEGDVLQLFSEGPAADLTGSAIEADARVAVFSGNIFTTYGFEVSGFAGGDLTHEQLPPTAAWGNQYVGAWLSPQTGCDPLFGAATGLWRVVAAEDGTRVTVSPAPRVTTDLAPLTFELGRGASRSFVVRGRVTSAGQGDPFPDFFIDADKPILLVQWLDCEPSLAFGVDTRLNSGALAFTLPPGFDSELVVVRARGMTVQLDGRPIEGSFLSQVAGQGAYELARVSSADLGRCVDQQDPCEHSLSGARYGVSWRGMDVVCSYALTIPVENLCELRNLACPE
jgi:hypothetical protein